MILFVKVQWIEKLELTKAEHDTPRNSGALRRAAHVGKSLVRDCGEMFDGIVFVI